MHPKSCTFRCHTARSPKQDVLEPPQIQAVVPHPEPRLLQVWMRKSGDHTFCRALCGLPSQITNFQTLACCMLPYILFLHNLAPHLRHRTPSSRTYGAYARNRRPSTMAGPWLGVDPCGWEAIPSCAFFLLSVVLDLFNDIGSGCCGLSASSTCVVRQVGEANITTTLQGQGPRLQPCHILMQALLLAAGSW